MDKVCLIGRTYSDFLSFLEDRPDCRPIVQMDSVEGCKGGKVLLTLHFVKCEFMPAFLRDRNSAASLFDVIERLYQELRSDRFMRLFRFFGEITKVNLMMDHINFYSQTNLGDHSLYEVFRMFYGQEILDLLGAYFISLNNVTLRPELLK